MRYSLDTNVCIRFVKGRSDRLTQKMHAVPFAQMVICSIVRAEMVYGAMKSQQAIRTLDEQQRFLSNFDSLGFDDQAARNFGELRAALERSGTLIGPYDMQIAAIAMANDLTLVTHNVKEFSRIQGLKWVDWES